MIRFLTRVRRDQACFYSQKILKRNPGLVLFSLQNLARSSNVEIQLLIKVPLVPSSGRIRKDMSTRHTWVLVIQQSNSTKAHRVTLLQSSIELFSHKSLRACQKNAFLCSSWAYSSNRDKEAFCCFKETNGGKMHKHKQLMALNPFRWFKIWILDREPAKQLGLKNT